MDSGEWVGRGVPMSVRTVCLPGSDSWQWAEGPALHNGRSQAWPACWGGLGWLEQSCFCAGAEPGWAMTLLSSASFPDAAACPGSLDCALKRRARCPPGAHVCGPCLQPFQEDQQGLCVPRMRQPLGMGGRGPSSPPPAPQPQLPGFLRFVGVEGTLTSKWPGRPFRKAPAQSWVAG